MVYPTGSILTELLSNENGICIFKATVVNNEHILGTGTAYEKENSTFINKTSYLENCETSAVGRALGMAGFGIDTSVASAEEVQNAMVQQDSNKSKEAGEKTINQTKVDALDKAIANNNLDEEKVLNTLGKYGYENTSQIKLKDYAEIINELQKLKE